MPHKKHKFKQTVIDHIDMSSKETAIASSSIGLQPSMGPKHDLPNDADNATASDRSQKRRKVNSNTGLEHHDPSTSDVLGAIMKDKIERPELAPDTSAQELPSEVRHLSSKYDFTTMSILSSAKINDKVKKLLLRVENFSFADPRSKLGIVILHAKSDVASKMVSIVEIARQDIEHRKGMWWQYSKLDEQITELKTKSVKRRGDGKTLSEWQKQRSEGEYRGVDGIGGETGRASEIQHDHEVVDGDEEMEGAFESMVIPKETDQGAQQSRDGNSGEKGPIPVMTIYFARVPVPGLKELYGYVPDYRMECSY